MSDGLVATVEQRRGGSSVIKLAGRLDERSALGEVSAQLGTGKVLINLAGVERIEAAGTRDWIAWLASLELRGVRPVLVACSPAVVAALNADTEFAGKAIVKNFQVPYRCDACDRTKLELVNVAEQRTRKEPPSGSCDDCGKPTACTESADYFAFVTKVSHEEQVAKKHESGPQFARGSTTEVESLGEKKLSKPRIASRSSRPSLSAFQGDKRGSQREITAPTPKVGSERPFLFAIVALLFATLGVLVYLLLGR